MKGKIKPEDSMQHYGTSMMFLQIKMIPLLVLQCTLISPDILYNLETQLYMHLCLGKELFEDESF